MNRLSEARRYDRTGGAGGWSLEARPRYRYDASNQRMVKQTLDSDPATNDPMERVHLYVYPGRYERSGLVTSGDGSVSVQKANQVPHSGGANQQSTLDAVAQGIGELNNRGVFGAEVSESIRSAVNQMTAESAAAEER